jgi:hypothetical protein
MLRSAALRVFMEKFGGYRPAGLGGDRDHTNITLVKGLVKLLYRCLRHVAAGLLQRRSEVSER